MKHKSLKIALSLTLTIVASTIFALPALAAPADPTPWTFEQPCGQIIALNTFGDEYFMWLETEGGNVVVFNQDTETLYYAYIEDGKLKPGDVPVGQSSRLRTEVLTRDNIQDVIQGVDRSVSSTYIPSLATPWRSLSYERLSIAQTHNRQPLLVLLLEFADREFCSSYLTTQFPTTTAYWSNHFFGTEGSTVNEWFRENSGDFNLQFTKPTFYESDGFFIQNPRAGVTSIRIQDGVAVVRLDQNHPDSNSVQGHPSPHVRPIVSLAFEAVAPFIDLSDVTRTGINVFNEDFNIYSVFAGYCESSAGGATRNPTMRGHVSSFFTRQNNFTENRWRNISFSIGEAGPRLATYGTQGELNQPGAAIGIGLAVHEISHLLRVQDLYDYTRESDGVSIYSVMGRGVWTRSPGGPAAGSPTHYGAWEKVALGFVEPRIVEVDDILGTRTFNVASHNSSQGQEILKVTSSVNPYQYFLIENRQPVGFDIGLSDQRFISRQNASGVLIWHVSKGAFGLVPSRPLPSNTDLMMHWTRPNNNWMHRGVALEGIEQIQTETPFFRADGRNAFNAETTPNSNFHEAGFCTYRLAAHNCHPQTVPSNVDIEILSNPAPVMQVQINGKVCPTVAEGRLPDQVGGDRLRGAPWELCECGVLKVREGFVHWTGTASPWNGLRNDINEIVFTGSITTGTSLERLFSNLANVETIEGLEHFNTSGVTNMNRVFGGMRSLTSLDISNWNTSSVTTMSSMFTNTDLLTILDVSNFDTSRVTSMAHMFLGANSLTALDVSGWDTSRVTSMNSMFGDTHSLTALDVSGWDTSRVTSMTTMFTRARSLTSLDLSNWDTRNVNQAHMNSIFSNMDTLSSLTLGENFVLRGGSMLPAVRTTSEFTGFWQNVGDGTPERPRGEHILTSAQLMAQFNGATMADTWVWQPRVTDDCFIVASARFADQVGGDRLMGALWVLCECGVVTVSGGFINWTATTSPWHAHRAAINEIIFTGSITAGTSLTNLFRDLPNMAAIEGLEHFDTSNVINMTGMFQSASSLTSLDVSSLDTSNVTNMTSMFGSTSSLTSLDVSSFDTSRVTNMTHMFSGARLLTSLDVSSFDTGNVTSMEGMFSWMTSLTVLDVSNFDTSNVTNMASMFSSMQSLLSLNVTNWNIGDSTRTNSMFISSPELRIIMMGEGFRFGNASLPTIVSSGFTGFWQNVGDGTVAQPQGIYELTSAQLMTQFNGATMADTWVWQPIPSDQVIITEGRFANQPGVNGLQGAAWELSECGVVTVGEGFINWTADTSPWIAHRTAVNEIVFAGSITAGTSLTNLFRDLPNLTAIKGLEYFDTSNVTNMTNMFMFARSLTDLDLSNWDTSRVTNMESMFAGARSLTDLDLSNWDTSRVTNMFQMFINAESLVSLDVSNWDTSRVTNMGSMFAGARSLTDVDVSNWDTSRVTNMGSMFRDARALVSLDVSNWDTSRVTNMFQMFFNAESLTALDLTSWSMNNMGIVGMNDIFSGMTELRSLTLGERFVFRGGSGFPAARWSPEFTGLWQNVGSGTPERPQGEYTLSGVDLMRRFNNATMADTWVWQPR